MVGLDFRWLIRWVLVPARMKMFEAAIICQQLILFGATITQFEPSVASETCFAPKFTDIKFQLTDVLSVGCYVNSQQ